MSGSVKSGKKKTRKKINAEHTEDAECAEKKEKRTGLKTRHYKKASL
jgi:hypothetical protein